jgi:hypothetical protein
MRLRFSVRLVLVVVAILAAVCYQLFARPTVHAEQFVSAVMGRDYRVAQSLMRSRSYRSPDSFFGIGTPFGRRATTRVVFIYAEMLPREWSDLWSFQRRVIFRVALEDDSEGRLTAWTEDTRLVAGPGGLEVLNEVHSP